LHEAEAAYWEAVAIRRELGEPNLLLESLSGLAHAHLAHKESEQALVVVEEIMTHLETHALEEDDEPLRVYLTCYEVLTACQSSRSQAVLETAYSLLQTQAEQINDEQLRHKFLMNVPAHREIAAAFSAE